MPPLNASRHVAWDDGQRLRSQVSLMDVLPDTTYPEHAKVQDALSTLDRPRHPRTLAALGEDAFTGGLREPTADGPMLASVGLLPPPRTALFAIGIGVCLDRGLARQAASGPSSRRRLPDARHPMSLCCQLCPPLLRPPRTRRARTQDAVRQWLDIWADMVIIDKP